jgi:hypothetical protein
MNKTFAALCIATVAAGSAFARAYVVVPANFTYKMKGKPMKETGSIMTVSLRKGDGGRRITAWSWARH